MDSIIGGVLIKAYVVVMVIASLVVVFKPTKRMENEQ